MYQPRTVACLALAVLTLCATGASAQARDHVQVVGSSTVYPFSSAVAENLGRTSRFHTPVVESTGTGGGFKLFCGGIGPAYPDVNDASRPITDAERLACEQHGVRQIAELRVGYDGIILAGPIQSAQVDVTLEQLWRATAKTVPVNGKWVANPYRRWSDVDPKLPPTPIRVYGPAPNHGTRDAFVELVLEPSCRHAPEHASLAKDDEKRICQTVREDGAWTDVSEDYALVVGKLAGDPDAKAIFTFSYLDQNRDRIRAATIAGVGASLETISSGRYPLSRPLFVYLKRQHVGTIPGLAEFAREFVSDRAAGADGYLADKGLIPMPAAERKRQQSLANALAARR